MEVYELPVITTAEITEGTDLNDLTLLNTIYYCRLNTIAATLVNCPIKYAFTLEVIPWGYGKNVVQRLTGYNNGRIYIRICATSTGVDVWSSWKQVADVEDVTTTNLKGVVPIAKGGTGVTSIADFRNAYGCNQQTYTNLSQLNLDAATVTELDIVAAMPSDSVMVLNANITSYPNLLIYQNTGVTKYGRFIIRKVSSNNYLFEYFGSEGGGYWFAAGNSSVTTLTYYLVAIEKGTNNIKTYTEVSQLGLNDGCTVLDICAALPKNSMFLMYVAASSTSTMGVPINGNLEVCKGSNANSATLRLTKYGGTTTQEVYFADWGNNSTEFVWKKIATNDKLSMPSNSTVTVNITASSETYTAPTDGWLAVDLITSGGSGDLILRNGKLCARMQGGYGLHLHCYLPLAKGQTATVTFEDGTINYVVFYYAQSEV